MIDISRTLSQLHVRFSGMGESLDKPIVCDRQRLFCSMNCQSTDAIIEWVKDICKELDIPRRCIEVCNDTYGTSGTHISVELGKLLDEKADSFEGLTVYLILRKGLRNYEDFTVSEANDFTENCESSNSYAKLPKISFA